jgi:hypothetical protein
MRDEQCIDTVKRSADFGDALLHRLPGQSGVDEQFRPFRLNVEGVSGRTARKHTIA